MAHWDEGGGALRWHYSSGITGARLGLLGDIGNWWSNGELGEHWGTVNWSKIRRITKAKTGEHFQLLFIL